MRINKNFSDYSFCIKSTIQRIKEKLSKSYPDRAKYFEGFEPIGDPKKRIFNVLFLNEICCIYYKEYGMFIDFDPETFDDLFKAFRNNEYFKSDMAKSKKYGVTVDNYADEDELKALMDDLHIDITVRDFSATQVKEVIYDALDTLSATQREIIIGLYYNEKTQADLAEELGCTQSTVSYQRVKAIKLIKQYFNDKGYEAEDFEL